MREEVLKRAWHLLNQSRFLAAAFLVAFVVRAIPEIMVGPNPVGFDTIAYYVPQTLDIAAGRLTIFQIIGTAPVIYTISVPAYLMAGIDPTLTFKVMGPVSYGLLISALFLFLRSTLHWSERASLGGALLASAYFVTLRISWDLYRTMLGLTFFIFAIPLIDKTGSTKQQLTLASLIMLAVASDQITGVLSLSIISLVLAKSFINSNRERSIRLAKVAIPGILLLSLIIYGQQAGSLLVQQSLVPQLNTLNDSLGFLVFAYLPLSPLIFLGFPEVSNTPLRIWTIVCLVLSTTSLLPLFGPIVASARWSILLTFPFCVYATAGVMRVVRRRSMQTKPGIIHSKLLFSIVILVILGASLYVLPPAQRSFAYYSAYPLYLPTSMIQSTIPASDMSSLRQLLGWVSSNLPFESVLITHQAIYGWAREYIPADKIINYGFSGPLQGLSIAKKEGFRSVLLIWWVNGSGWYGQVSVPGGFTQLYSEGELAVYGH